MNKSLHELAVASAAAHYKAAQLAIFNELNSAKPDENFDSLHQASIRALDLHVSSLAFAERVWSANITYEKAESALLAKFGDFPRELVCHALSSAYAYKR
jgi:hypothetical protein